MSSSKLCQLANVATATLDKYVAEIVSHAALAQYEKIVDLIKEYTCIDLNEFFVCISLLAVLCWVSQWLNDIIIFVCVGYFNLYLFMLQLNTLTSILMY